MAQLLEFAANHPIRIGAFVLFASLLLALELWRLRQGGSKISPMKVVSLINQGQPVILDLRAKADYERGHIAAARHAPPSQLPQVIKQHPPGERPVILYCANGMQAGGFATKAREAGAKEVYVLQGGVAAWQEASLPLERG